MKQRIVLLLLGFVLLGGVYPARAQKTIEPKDALSRSEPIEIVSDRMEAFQEKRLVVFSGNAIATQGDIRLRTDRLSFYYRPSEKKTDALGKHNVEAQGELDRIEAKGHVVISQKDISATGDEAVYYQKDAKIVMTGNPVLQDGKNMIKGCQVVIYINDNIGKVEKCETEQNSRVTAIIHPQGESKKEQ